METKHIQQLFFDQIKAVTKLSLLNNKTAQLNLKRYRQTEFGGTSLYALRR